MNNVISMPPKSKRGAHRNVEWSITYVTASRTWHWRVVITLEPQIMEGDTDDEGGARAAVNDILHKLDIRGYRVR